MQELTLSIRFASSITFPLRSLPDDGFRYVYAVCSKTGTDALIEFTQEKIKFDDNVNDFYFLLGVLHSVVDDVRVLSITIGTTTINGALIRTGTISSLDMQTYFNLDSGEIKGKIKFLNGSDGFTSIDGGLLMSEVIEVGEDGDVNAFVSGKTDVSDTTGVSVRFGAGADYAGRNTAPFRVQQNGKMIAENAEIRGKIFAQSGEIADFKIEGSQIMQTTTFNGGPWTIYSTYTSITSSSILYRTIQTSVDDIKEVVFGTTSAPSTGFLGAMALIRNNIIDPLPGSRNVALRLESKNAANSIALEIGAGDIAIGSRKGQSGLFQYRDQNGVTQALEFEKGILVAHS
ncbi:hypothetical protein [Chryseobacterium wangxinyae]|uniref:hypothetical protein n=1 Tax=Chryseobacterium sp. CY353 TaxID=2997334 RepID=UPI002271E9CA|nr:hypothetical protein [Chryseobacterium sp. CY353]MCY0967901.1 hypothetical protein [Chryseobacterium sp. CY353]